MIYSSFFISGRAGVARNLKLELEMKDLINVPNISNKQKTIFVDLKILYFLLFI